MYDRAAVCPVILKRMADGESLRSICRDEAMPHIDTVQGWLGEDAVFSAQDARARELRGDYYADRVIEVISQRPPDVGDTNHKAGESRMDSGYVAWQRVQADNY